MANPNQQTTQRTEDHTPPAQQALRPGGEKRFLVQETAQIARGGSHYTLTKGKTISSHGYNIQALLAQGVKLEEVA